MDFFASSWEDEAITLYEGKTKDSHLAHPGHWTRARGVQSLRSKGGLGLGLG